MPKTIPGTTMPFTEACRSDAFAQLSPILEATGGLTLSQLAKLTGLEGSTIQNWVKRGWVAGMSGKRYGEVQIVRILLIHMVHGSMQLEKINRILEYINGDVADPSDDVLPDTVLFNLLCSIIADAEDRHIQTQAALETLLTERLEHCHVENEPARHKLHNTLLVMTLAYWSVQMVKTMNAAYAYIEETTEG